MYAIGGTGLIATPLTLTVAEDTIINTYGATRTITLQVSNIGATTLLAPWRMRITIDNLYSFSGACSNILYGKTTDEVPVDFTLAATDYDCNFAAEATDGYIVVLKDLPSGNSTWKMAWSLGIRNPLQQASSSNVEVWLMDNSSSYTPYHAKFVSTVLATPKETGAITPKVMWGVTPDVSNGFGFY